MKTGTMLLVCETCNTAKTAPKEALSVAENLECDLCKGQKLIYAAVYSGKRFKWVLWKGDSEVKIRVPVAKPQLMGHVTVYLLLLMCVLTACIGCAHLLGQKVRAESPMLMTPGLTTNDTMLVAYLKEAQAANRAFNVTPSAVPIHTVLDGAIILAAAASGWYARHRSGRASAANAEGILRAGRGLPTDEPPQHRNGS